ncbi:MAG: DUF1080 domain-containing protein [Verrucomicrobiae bacterium]|nr:DUF1080 domain-containing protein [Verrucomicrobiae bacterium]
MRLPATLRLAAALVPATLTVVANPVFDWPQHDRTRPLPPIIDPGSASTPDRAGRAPSDAVVLFDGSSLDGWVAADGSPPRWVIRDGALECVRGGGYVRSLRAFGDCQVHLEWAAPTPPRGSSQGRGNSGVFLMGQYEVQILDSHDNETYADGQAGAVYGQHPPLVNAARPAGEWQSYDIIFTRPRFDAEGRVVSPARMTVFHNGVLVQHEVALVGPTGWLQRQPYRPHADKLPLSLQDHGNPVRFRNIWVRELGADARRAEMVFSRATLDRLRGTFRFEDGLTVSIARPGDLLEATFGFPGRGMTFPLHAESRDRFYIRSFDGEIDFRTGPDGTAESVVLRVSGEARTGRRQP